MDLALSDALLSPPDHAVPRPYAADPLLLLPFASAWATLAPRERERETAERERETAVVGATLAPAPRPPGSAAASASLPAGSPQAGTAGHASAGPDSDAGGAGCDWAVVTVGGVGTVRPAVVAAWAAATRAAAGGTEVGGTGDAGRVCWVAAGVGDGSGTDAAGTAWMRRAEAAGVPAGAVRFSGREWWRMWAGARSETEGGRAIGVAGQVCEACGAAWERAALSRAARVVAVAGLDERDRVWAGMELHGHGDGLGRPQLRVRIPKARGRLTLTHNEF